MKTSAYNSYITTDDGRMLAFNSISGTILPIDENVHAFLTGRTVLKPAPLQMRKLCKAGLLVDRRLDELKVISKYLQAMRRQTDVLQYTLVMTYACNLKCPYCYEDSIGDRSGSMTDETAKRVVTYLADQIALHRSRKLSLTLYGGEPLLNYPRSVYILDHIAKLCQQRGLTFLGAIITNGVLLNQSRIKTLSRYISLAQVTLEGGAGYHDRIRKTTGGKSTFGIILEAIRRMVATGIRVNIRIQVSRESLASLNECFHALDAEGLLHHPLTSLYFFPIMNIGKVCSARAYQCSERYYDKKIFRKLWDYSLRYPVKAAPLPAPVWLAPYCSFVHQGAWIIDPNGRKYKCVSMLGKRDGQCGDIDGGEHQKQAALYHLREQQFLSRSGVGISTCRQCEYLPVCDGGCTYLAQEFGGSMDSFYCDMHKNSIKDHLALLYKKNQSESHYASV